MKLISNTLPLTEKISNAVTYFYGLPKLALLIKL